MNALYILSDVRGLTFFAGLFLCWALETRFGDRSRVDPALRHDAENLLLAAINVALFAAPLAGLSASYTDALGERRIGLLNQVSMPSAPRALLLIVCFDGIIYATHRAYHRIAFLWRFHRVHHTEGDLNVTSASRFHPGEIFLSTLFRWGVMIPLIGPTGSALAVFDVVYIFLGQIQHGNFRLPRVIEPAMRLVFITPDMHRVHHSEAPEETNANFGVIFSFWDRLFGTYRMVPQEEIVLGLPAYRRRKDRTFSRLLSMPFALTHRSTP